MGFEPPTTGGGSAVTAAQGTPAAVGNAWPIAVTDGTHIITPGDNANSAIRVNVVAGGAAGGTSSSYGAAFPATGTASGFSDGTNMQGARVFDLDTGGGTEYNQGASLRISANGGSIEAKGQKVMASSIPVTIASDQSAVTVTVGSALPAGTNVIGHTITDSGSTTAVTSLPATPAGTNLIGRLGAFPGVGQIIDSSGVAHAVSSAFANVAASQTDSVIQALSGSLTTYVFAVVCVCGATATNITFNSKPAGAGSAISPLFANAANGGIVLPFTGSPWFQSASSAGISVTTGAGSTTGVLILYAQF